MLWIKNHKKTTGLLVALLLLFAVFLRLSAWDDSTRPSADLSQVHPESTPGTLRDVVVVGNNWDGTADVFDPTTFKKLKRFDIVPDFDERMAEVNSSRIRRLFFRLIRNLIGEGHNQLVDDMFTSHDGKFLFVSRPSFADVISVEVQTGKIVWRTKVDGNRADHAAI
ncbi:MAG TPA: hypothetical protein PLG78_15015, partial [Leptospiraceae bacterium]|nr:hypothetical protein [Leptospiraceae bacterium]